MHEKFVNNLDEVVSESLLGLVNSNRQIQFHPNNNRILVRSDYKEVIRRGKVTVLCGGGSGHEPFAAGFVGYRGLTAAVAGEIYASPPSADVSAALNYALSSAGSIIFCNNYTGDRLHFGMALEQIKSNKKDAKVDLVFIDDDVSLEQKEGFNTGRRGLAATVLVLHCAVIMSENGKSFEEILEDTKEMIQNVGTFGVSLYPCALPGRGYMFDLENDKIELGLGIHGEPGLERIQMLPTSELINIVMPKLAFSNRLGLDKEKVPVVILLNNLGVVSGLETNILLGEILEWCKSHEINVKRIFRGTLTSSIDGHGVSISMLKLTRPHWLQNLEESSALSSLWVSSIPNP